MTDDSASMTAADEGVSGSEVACPSPIDQTPDEWSAQSPVLCLRGGARPRKKRRKAQYRSQYWNDKPMDDSGPERSPRARSAPAKETIDSLPSSDKESLKEDHGQDVLQPPSTPVKGRVSSAESSPLSSAPSNPRTPTPIPPHRAYLAPKTDADSPLSSAPSSLHLPAIPLTTKDEGDNKADSNPKANGIRKKQSTDSGVKLRKSRKQYPKTSPYFPTPPKPPHKQISCIPFPPLSSTRFGLVQESLASHPFHLLIAVIFLNKTRGAVAMPVFYTFIARFPDPASLAAAEQTVVVSYFQNLGLQNQRAKKCIALAKAWLEHPPVRGKRWRRLHYPMLGNGKDIKSSEEPIADEEEDARMAWEVGHLPGIGAYGIDSWRIFCRDDLRGLGPSVLPELGDGGEEARKMIEEEEIKREWTRVVPTDKELRAYLRWRWLRLGWEWDPKTGERRRAEEKVVREAESGGVIYEGEGGWTLEGKGDEHGECKTREVESGKGGSLDTNGNNKEAE